MGEWGGGLRTGPVKTGQDLLAQVPVREVIFAAVDGVGKLRWRRRRRVCRRGGVGSRVCMFVGGRGN